MQGYNRIFDLLMELSDRCESDGLQITAERLELAMDALLAETRRLPVRPAAPAPIPERAPWRAGARLRAKRRLGDLAAGA